MGADRREEFGGRSWAVVVAGAAIMLAAAYLGSRNFLAFHTVTEGFTIVVSFTIAVIVFNTYENIDNSFIPILGVAYFCAGFFDILHTLAYEGMMIIPGAGADLAPQMWLVARFLDSVGMILAGLSFDRTIRPAVMLAVYALVSLTALLAEFVWGVFPVAFIPGQGLTQFKVYSEFVIVFFLVVSVGLLMRQRGRFRPEVYRLLLAFFLASVGTELSFSFYITMSGWQNIVGHLFKVSAFLFLYRAVVVTSLQEPYARLRQSREELRQLNADLERRVQERTQALEEINATMKREIGERQAAQEALRKSRDKLLDRERQLKLYTSQLAAANRELAAANTEIKSFANIVAHDFRTPMVNIKGFSRELADSLADLRAMVGDVLRALPEQSRRQAENLLEGEIPEALRFIDSSVDRLNRMVEALLKLARLGRRELVYETIDMNSLVDNVLLSYGKLIELGGIKVTVGQLPAIEGDRVALEQIVGNLVDNAIKYLEPGRPGEVFVTGQETGEDFLFTVGDNGRGVDEADQEQIFEVFRRAGSQEVPGDGMGLAYVRTLVRQLGGKVWCESQPGVGTRMRFTVPNKEAI